MIFTFSRFSFLPIYGLWKFLSIFDFLWFNGDAGWEHMTCMYIICIINQTVSSSHYYYLSYPHLTSSLACGVTYIEWKYKIFLSMRRWKAKNMRDIILYLQAIRPQNSRERKLPNWQNALFQDMRFIIQETFQYVTISFFSFLHSICVR